MQALNHHTLTGSPGSLIIPVDHPDHNATVLAVLDRLSAGARPLVLPAPTGHAKVWQDSVDAECRAAVAQLNKGR